MDVFGSEGYWAFMSRQRFSAVQREALWLAHNKKCAYSRELLDVSDFHIDHIIPETLANDPVKFQKVRAQLGLTDGFDPHGFENLLPCRPGTNLQKRDTLFDPARTHFFLGVAAGKKDQVQALLNKIEMRDNRGRALILLQQCFERGALTHLEVADMLEKYSERPEEIFHLIDLMKFSDAVELQAIAKADIEDLRKRPVHFGNNDHIDGVTLTNDADKHLFVRTCIEYDEPLLGGYYPLSNFDIKTSAFFEHQCGVLKALQGAQIPERSFITEPRVGIVDLELLPFSFFPSIGDEDCTALTAATATYQSKVDDGTKIVRGVGHNRLRVEEAEGMGQSLTEVARADFSGDEIEDILLFEYCYATHGTLGFGTIRILTRKSPDGLFEEISL